MYIRQSHSHVNLTGSGDPVRTLALLWREPADVPGSQRGPRPGLDLRALVEAAIALADAEGLDAVSMRRVAQLLGVSPMSLYTYVPGKGELLDLMVDACYARMERRAPADGSWRARLQAIADDHRALFRSHPWLVDVSTVRPPLGPGLMQKYEYELRALDGLGLTDLEMDAALSFLLGFVETIARADAVSRPAAGDLASDAAWWEAQAPLLARVFDPTRFPTAARVGSAAGEAQGAAFDPDLAYGFGMERALDGLALLIASRRA